MSEPPKPPTPSDELRRIRLGISALSGTAHVFLGSFLIFFSEPESELEPNTVAGFGMLLVIIGLAQKLFAFAEWIDVIRRVK